MKRSSSDSRLQLLSAKLFLQQLGENLTRGAKIGRAAAEQVIAAVDEQSRRSHFQYSAAMLERLGALRLALGTGSEIAIDKAAKSLRSHCLTVIRKYDDGAHTRGEKRQLAGAFSGGPLGFADFD